MPTLTWIGKEAVENHHQQVPFHLLKDVPELACGQPGDGNLIVQGDNLVALKALLPYYAGQVKCIYIDPPYNTGNEGWVYNDNVNSPIIREWLGKTVGKEGETLDRHDRWLCMMYPRLALLRQFLREDGAIFVSIDEAEQAHLRLLMDEVFGSSNFVADMVWAAGRKNDSKLVSVSHEYIVCYARSKTTLADRKIIWRQRKKGLKDIYAQHERLKRQLGDDFETITAEIKRWYKELPDSHPAKAHKHYCQVDRRGVYFAADISWPGGGGPQYSVIHPRTKKPVKNPARGWSTPDPEKMRAWIEDDRVHFGLDETSVPCLKSYLKDKELQTPYSVFYQDGRAATKRLRGLLGSDKFEFPKDEEVIQEVFSMLTGGDDLILDSFAGSGTTGHAVLKQNAEDGGNRRFILVEMEPHIARNVTAERVRRVAQGYTNAKGERVEGLGGGFRYCELGEPLFDEHGKIRDTVRFADLARHVYFSETGEPLPSESIPDTPLIGVHRGVSIYLLYNGILGDASEDGGNVLTRATLAQLPPFAGPKIIYCAGCLLGHDRLQAEGIRVRQIPYEIKVS